VFISRSPAAPVLEISQNHIYTVLNVKNLKINQSLLHITDYEFQR
jgi:hypothetical protein